MCGEGAYRRKLGAWEAYTHGQRWSQENGLAWGVESYVNS